MTLDPAGDFDPTWSPDGTRVVFNSVRTEGPGAGTRNLYWHASSGGPDEFLVHGTSDSDWSLDGRFLAYTLDDDLWILPFTGDRKPFRFLQTPFLETDPAFSPDGRWLAYQSNESGSPQVYVQPFPASGGRYQISHATGTEPRWRGDGKELFFLAADGTMMAAGVDTTKDFRATVPQALFQTGIFSGNNHPYVVAKDGSRFLLPVSDRPANRSITVVVNWPSSIQK